jgi:3-methyladenine DNA glycosylase/8-oxoguanine DNA glycosylase
MLRGLVKQNAAAAVARASEKAFALLAEGDWVEAIKALAELRGVGPATASGISFCNHKTAFIVGY